MATSLFDTTPQLDCAGRPLRLDRVRIAGIINVPRIRFPMRVSMPIPRAP